MQPPVPQDVTPEPAQSRASSERSLMAAATSIPLVRAAGRSVKRALRRIAPDPWLIPAPQRVPPPCPPGWRTGPPDFVGIGVQKSGTSWWHALVVAHPGVQHPPQLPKELHFFGEYWQRPFTGADVERYAALFPRPAGVLTGEWTPRYIADFWTIPLLAQAAPDTKVLVVLRDPVSRYVSGVTFNRTHGAGDHPTGPMEAVHRGYYGGQLDRVFAHFPRDQVLVLQYEQCRRDTRAELARTYRFLGVDPEFVPPTLNERVNETTAQKSHVPDHVIAALRDVYAADVAHLAELVPTLDLRLWPAFAHLHRS